jgi:hypothetical protein
LTLTLTGWRAGKEPKSAYANIGVEAACGSTTDETAVEHGVHHRPNRSCGWWLDGERLSVMDEDFCLAKRPSSLTSEEVDAVSPVSAHKFQFP